MQERRNSSANALELRLFCTEPWILFITLPAGDVAVIYQSKIDILNFDILNFCIKNARWLS